MIELSTIIYRVPALLFAITVHEYAHAMAADSMGDKTAKYMGRMTLNPLAHLDPIGALLLVVAGFGWAKPVPINPNNFRNRREGLIKVSLAGPLGNLFLAFACAVLHIVFRNMGMLSSNMNLFLSWMQLYNVWFAFFNLVPIPPLDGSKVLIELLPPKMAWDYQDIMGRYGFYILIALVFTGVIGWFIQPLATIFLSLVYTLLGYII